MNVVTHYPETPEKQAELATIVAKIHATQIEDYISKLTCSTVQKLALLDAIIEEIKRAE